MSPQQRLFVYPAGFKSSTLSDARVKLSKVSPWSSQWRRAPFESRGETGTPSSSAHPSLLFDHSCCSGWSLRCSATVSQPTVLLALSLSLFPLIHTATAAVHSSARPTRRNKSPLSLAVSWPKPAARCRPYAATSIILQLFTLHYQVHQFLWCFTVQTAWVCWCSSLAEHNCCFSVSQGPKYATGVCVVLEQRQRLLDQKNRRVGTFQRKPSLTPVKLDFNFSDF